MSFSLAIDNKSSLNRVWLAAHWDRKLSRQAIASHNIKDSIDIIKAPGSLYTLRISAFLMLGLVKIMAKKSVLAVEDAEQILDSLNEATSESTSSLIQPPEKLKLGSLRKMEALSLKTIELEPPKPLFHNISLTEKPKYNINVVENNDILASNLNFLDDVEMLEHWLEPDEEKKIPAKRPREEPIWHSLVDEEAPRQEVEEPIEEPLLQIKPDEEEIPIKNVKVFRKKFVKREDVDTFIDIEEFSGLDCTHDVVKQYRLFTNSSELVSENSDFILFRSLSEFMSDELTNFFTSNIKLLRLKNALRELEGCDDDDDKDSPVHEDIVEKYQNVHQEEYPEIYQEKCEEDEIEDDDEHENSNEVNSRTRKLLSMLNRVLKAKASVNMTELSTKKERRVIACAFYELLILAVKDFVYLAQNGNDIVISPTQKLQGL